MLKRTDNSIFTKWWFEIDKTVLFSVLFFIVIGMMTVIATGPIAAGRTNTYEFFFVQKYFMYMGIGVMALIVASFLPLKWVKRLSIIGFIFLIPLLLITLFSNPVKGGKRWISIFGQTVQPSEYLKPIFAVVVAMILVKIHELFLVGDRRRARNYILLLVFIFITILGMLLLQPDIGMSFLFFIIFVSEVFVAGLPWIFVISIILFGISGLVGAYFIFPHFYNRINKFIFGGDTYQSDMSLNTIREAGILGNFSESLKKTIPDVHTDFVFSAIIENFGPLMSIIILIVFMLMALHIFNQLKIKKNPFIVFTGSGIIAYFISQVIINISSTLGMIPTKGMTLPFISYGGSSFIASAVGIGILLAILQERNVRGD